MSTKSLITKTTRKPDMFKVNNRNTCSSVFIVNFEQVNARWDYLMI